MANDRFVVEDFIPQDKPQITTEMVNQLAYEEANKMPASRATTDGTDRRMSVMAASLDSKDPAMQVDKYNQIMSDLTTNGFSQALVDIKNLAKEREERLAKVTVGNLLTDGTFSELPPEQAVSGLHKYVQDMREENLDTMFAKNMYMQAEEQDAESQKALDGFGVDGVRKMVEHQANVQAIANDWYRQNDKNAAQLTVGLIPSLIPFVDGAAVKRELEEYQTLANDHMEKGTIRAFVMPSSVKRHILKALDRMKIEDPVKYEEVAGGLISSMRDSSSVLVRNDGDASIRVEEVLGGNEGYATWMAALDNIGAGTDAVVALRSGLKGLKNLVQSGGKLQVGSPSGKFRHLGIYSQAAFSEELVKHAKAAEAAKTATVAPVATASAGKVASHTNSDAAKAMYEMAMKDPEAAKAFFGTDNIADVVADAHAPQVGRLDGAIEGKVYVPDKNVLADVLEEGNPLLLDKADKAKAIGNIERDLRSPGSLRLVPNMTTIETEAGGLSIAEGANIASKGDRVFINAVYKLRDSGYTSVKNVKDIVEIELAKRGFSRDNITVMRKRTDGMYYALEDDVVFEKAARAAKDVEAKSQRELFAKGPGDKIEAGSKRDMFKQGPGVTDGSKRDLFAKGPGDKIEAGSKRDMFKQGPGVTDGSKRDLFAKGPQAKTPEVLPAGSKRADMLKGPTQTPEEVKAAREAKAAPKPSDAIPDPLEDFIIVVRDQHKLSASDVIGSADLGKKSMSDIRVSNNFFDRAFSTWRYNSGVESGWGSLQQHVLSAADMFKDKFVDQALSFAKDRASTITRVLMEDAKQLDKSFQKFTNPEQRALVNYFIRANREQLAFNPEWALSEGWSYNMIKHAYDFRKVWDEIYGLENMDAVRTLHRDGWSKFIDRAHGGTEHIVKDIPHNQLHKHADKVGIEVFDTEQNILRRLNNDEISRLYKTGGTVSMIRRPIDVDGKTAKYLLTSNQPGFSFTRALRDDDMVIGYNPGYYAVRYKDPWFITRKVFNEKDEYLYEAAIGTAKNKREADLLKTNLMNRELEGAYHVDDFIIREGRNVDPVLRQQYNLDMHMAGGRSAQRTRGEQMLMTVNSMDDLGFDHIESPMESLVHSIKSISDRISVSDWFDTIKTRLLDTHAEVLPKDDFGRPRLPSSPQEIQNYDRIAGGDFKVGSAKSTYNYIAAMEGAWINHIDEMWKAGMHKMALTVADASVSKGGKVGKALSHAEGAIRWAGGKGPVGQLNKLATVVYLHSKPIRQFYINAAQSIQLAGIAHPDWFFKKGYAQFAAISARMAGAEVPAKVLKVTGWTNAEFDKHFMGFVKSGFPYALDQQNMMRGVLLDLAERQTKSKVYQAVTAPLHMSRRAGSDAGEYVNMLSAYLAFADKAKRAGKSIDDAEVLAETQQAARNFTGNMNPAGDMPYNHNMLAPLFKFQQVSQKLLLNMFTNQHLTGAEKRRLLFTNLVLFGVPVSTAVEQGVTKLYPDDPNARNLFMEGIYSWMMNETIQLMSGSTTRLDFSASLSPFQASVVETAHAILTTDMPTLMAKSAGAGLLFGNNPVLSRFAHELLNWIVPQEGMMETDSMDVAKAGLAMFGQMDSIFKAQYILEHSAVKNSAGQIIDYDSDKIVALAAIAGIDPIDVSKNRGVQAALYKDYINKEENIRQAQKILFNQMSLRGMDVHDQKRIQQAYAIGYKMFKKDPKFFDEWTKAVDKAASSTEHDIFLNLYDQLNTGNLDNTIEMTKNLPDSPDKEMMLNSLQMLKSVPMFSEEEE